MDWWMPWITGEKAPAAAQRDMYLDEHGEVVDSLSRYGSLAAGVPGTVAGLLTAWRKYGKIKELSLLLNPAIQIAEQGYRLNEDEVDRLNYYREDFLKYNKHDIPFVKEGEWEPGDILKQKELANTLREILLNEEAGFYGSWVAERIDSQMRADGGRITLDDLQAYQALWRKPVSASYREYRLFSMPPPSSGGIALAQLVKMVEAFDLKKMGFQNTESIHLMVESERRVYADRASHLGDADYYEVPDFMLLDSLYLLKRMQNFSWDRATPSDSIREGGPILVESFETTHTSIIDQEGMAVSVTTTLNSNFGSKVWVKEAGFFLNNEMDDFSVKPGVANQFGLVGGTANAIEGGKRMLSSMTPTIIEKEGQLFMVLGTPGGSTIITSVFQVFLNVAEFGMNMTEAVRAPRFHHQWLPDRIIIEKGKMDSLTMDSLKRKGHTFEEYDKIGLVKAILVKEDGSLQAVGDTRSFDDVEGF
jgi:gamma-glutamyltranspeptidase/glutathione hydrolase